MDSAHTLILLNGERINGTDDFIGHSNFQSSWANIANIKKIEIIKGAGSVLYGSEAMGGVINIITKSANKNNYNRLNIASSVADKRDGGETKSIAYSGGHKLGNKLYLTTNLSTSDKKYVKNDDGTDVDLEAIKKRSADIDLAFQATKNTEITIGLLRSNEKRNKLDPYYNIDRAKNKLGLKHQVGRWSVILNAYENSTDAAWDSFGKSPYYIHKIDESVISAELQGKVTTKQYLTLGFEQHKVDYFKDYHKGRNSSDYHAKGTKQNSIYLQDKLRLDGDTLIAGIRFDDNSQFGHGTSPSLGYIHSMPNGWSLKGNISQAYKAPNIKQADSNYIFKQHRARSAFVGNSNLKPETSRNMEIALAKKGQRADWSVALYQTKVKDMINTQNSGQNAEGFSLFTYKNTDHATIKGLEIAINADLTQNLFLDTSFTYMTTDNGQGDELSYRPKTITKATLSYDTGPWTHSLSATHTGKAVDTRNESIASHTLVDAAINRKLSKNITAQLAFNNLTNKTLDNPDDNHMAELMGREVKLSFIANF